MPRPRTTLPERWELISRTLNIQPGIYELQEDSVRCTYCYKTLYSVTLFDIRRHEETQNHLTVVALRAANVTASDSAWENCAERMNAFYFELADVFMAADIPFEKLNHQKFRGFLQKYTRNNIPDPSTLRKNYSNLIYQRTLSTIREEIGENKIYVSADETTDAEGRCIVNVIVGPLLHDHPGIPRLINSSTVPIANADCIVDFVSRSLLLLWTHLDLPYSNRLLLYLSDGAPYMMRSGRLLRETFPKMIHVSCVAHGLHRVAEEVRNFYENANNIIANTKAVFKKAPTRVQLFRELSPDLPLPPEPIVTRWGEWLSAASYYAENFQVVQNIIFQMVPDNIAVRHAQRYFRKARVEEDFLFIHENFSCINESIKQLETRNMSLHDSITIISNLLNLLLNNNNIPPDISQKLQNVIINNTGFSTDLIEIHNILDGNEGNIRGNWTEDDVQCMKYAPVTTSELERSFSHFKSLLRDNRHSLLLDNLTMFVVTYYNKC